MAGTHLVEGYLGEACPGAIDDAETLLTPKRKDGAGERERERENERENGEYDVCLALHYHLLSPETPLSLSCIK